jgi:hypothetical protein
VPEAESQERYILLQAKQRKVVVVRKIFYMGGSRSDVSGAADASLPAAMWHDEGEFKKTPFQEATRTFIVR